MKSRSNSIQEPKTSSSSLSREMAGARLGDQRLSQRLVRISEVLSRHPDEGFPKALESEAELEGFYRFINHEEVGHQAVLEPHFQATCERAWQQPWIAVIHDTSCFQFNGDIPRKGLGITTNSRKGFYGHFALAVSPDHLNEPLGVIGFQSFCRTGKKFHKSGKKKKRYLSELKKDPNKESLRWGALVEQVEERLQERVPSIHVMDREADCYDLFSEMVASQHRFVIRLARNRNLYSANRMSLKGKSLYQSLQSFPSVLEKEVPLSSRSKSSPYYCDGRHPVRKQRMAKLRFAAKAILIKRSESADRKHPDYLKLNVVRVYEVNTPRGEEPIEWLLITTEPIRTKKDVERVVDIYRSRWLIEEYFKALKTGCAYEKRQLESYSALLNALAILIPIAWQLLLLRNLARSRPQAPANEAMSLSQIEVLRSVSRKKVPAHPTLQDALLAVAALGGHLSHNGPPGWQVLGRGYQELILLERGWMAAKRKQKCDQS